MESGRDEDEEGLSEAASHRSDSSWIRRKYSYTPAASSRTVTGAIREELKEEAVDDIAAETSPRTKRTATERESSSRKASDSPKKRKISRKYDDPSADGGGAYGHLSGIPDHLGPDLDVLLVGINPGVVSATTGHHYAHGTNHFYPALHRSGLTRELVPFSEDHTFPTLSPFKLGLTNLAHRPTAESSELDHRDFAAGTPVLLRKVAQYRPRVVCFVGQGIAKEFEVSLREIGALPPAKSAAATKRQSAPSAREVAAPSQSALTRTHHPATTAAVRVPRNCPWAPPKGGTGLLPFCLMHQTQALPQPCKDLTVMKEDEDDAEVKFSLSWLAESRDPTSSCLHNQSPSAAAATSGEKQPAEASLAPATADGGRMREKTLFWAVPSTSARVTSVQLPGKIACFQQVRELIEALQSRTEAKAFDDAIRGDDGEWMTREVQSINLLALSVP